MRLALASSLVLVCCAAAFAAAPAQAASDRCVQGSWRMSNARANGFLQDLIGNPLVRVKSGVLTAAFRGGEMRYGSTYFVLEMSLGTAVLRATANFLVEARYRTANRRLILSPGQSEITISKWKAIKDGKTATVPGLPPKTTATPAGSTPYTCANGVLRWKVPFPGPNGIWAPFTRVR